MSHPKRALFDKFREVDVTLWALQQLVSKGVKTDVYRARLALQSIENSQITKDERAVILASLGEVENQFAIRKIRGACNECCLPAGNCACAEKEGK